MQLSSKMQTTLLLGFLVKVSLGTDQEISQRLAFSRDEQGATELTFYCRKQKHIIRDVLGVAAGTAAAVGTTIAGGGAAVPYGVVGGAAIAGATAGFTKKSGGDRTFKFWVEEHKEKPRLFCKIGYSKRWFGALSHRPRMYVKAIHFDNTRQDRVLLKLKATHFLGKACNRWIYFKEDEASKQAFFKPLRKAIYGKLHPVRDFEPKTLSITIRQSMTKKSRFLGHTDIRDERIRLLKSACCKKCRHQKGTVMGNDNDVVDVYPILQESHLLATFFGHKDFKQVLEHYRIATADVHEIKIAELSRFEKFMTIKRRLSSENRPIHALFREICIQEANETES